MAKSDIAIKQWLRNKTRFADLFNGVIFNGEQVISPYDLVEISGESDIILEDKELKRRGIERRRDIIMQWQGVSLVILAVESQSYVNYAMPVRNMLYDSLAYIDQAKAAWEKLCDDEKKSISNEEFLSRFRKDDTIYPVITIVFYYGSDMDWDGAHTLHDMFRDLKLDDKNRKIIESYVPDYKINLVDVSNIEELNRFKSDLHIMFGMVKCKKDKNKLLSYTKENKDFFSNMDEESRYAAEELLRAEKFFKNMDIKTESGGMDMCKALQDLLNEGIQIGEERGISIGEARGISIGEERGIMEGVCRIILQIKKKIIKGKSIEVIADELETTVPEIQEYYDAILSQGTDKTPEEIYEYIKSKVSDI